MRKKGGSKVILRRIKTILTGAILMVATFAASTVPAQAQETFDVSCFGQGQQEDCLGTSPSFQGEGFDCESAEAAPGTASQCTRELTGETFDCEIADITGFDTTHRCVIPAPEAPGQHQQPGAAGGGGGAAPTTQGFEQETGDTGEVNLLVNVS
jgi:hypothetical protein